MKSSPDNRRDQPGRTAPGPATLLATEKVTVHPGGGATPLTRCSFPGPRNAGVALRVAFERRASADLIAHAKESLEVEVCGILAGELCEDEEGPFVRVSAALRGTAAAEASTHVTFTQATWNAIHQTLDRDYPHLKIVGWYHTHPGFGVEFSDMDVFIQQNFFSGPAQIAMVTDPLSGAVAICVNTAQGIRYLPRYWVDGREQPCRVPVAQSQPAAGGAVPAPADVSPNALAQLEARLSQLIQATDEQRAWQQNFLLFCGLVFGLGIVVAVGYFVLQLNASRLEPPRVNSMVPIPIQVGEKRVMVGVALVEWDVPEELNALLLQEHLKRREAAERAAQEAQRQREKEAKSSTNAPAAGTNANGLPANRTTNP